MVRLSKDVKLSSLTCCCVFKRFSLSNSATPDTTSHKTPMSMLKMVMAAISTLTVRSPCVRVAGLVGGLEMGARRALAARV